MYPQLGLRDIFKGGTSDNATMRQRIKGTVSQDF